MAKTFQLDFVINGLVNRNFSGSINSVRNGLINISKESLALKGKLNALDKSLINGEIDFEGYAQKANKVKNQLKALELQQERLNKVIAAKGKLKTAAMEFTGLALGIYAASRPIAGMINVASEFEETMSRVKAITSANTEEMAQLTDEAKRLGRTTPFTARQSAEAMTYLGMAGWKTSQILKGMPGLLNLALAGKTDLARTADIISDDLTAFGLRAEKAEHMADVFAHTIVNTNTNVEMLGETMKYAAPVAHAFGASLEETAALAGLMANGSIKASQAGTSLRMGLLRLAGPPKKASKALDELGVSLSDATKAQAEAQAAIKSLGIEMATTDGPKPMLKIVTELREKLNQLGKQERLNMAQKIFGVQASSGWLNVFDAAPEKFAALVNELDKCDGASARIAKTMTANTKGAMTRLQSSLEGVSLAVGSVFLPALADAAEGASGLTSKLGDFAEKYPGLIKAVGTIGLTMAGTALAMKAAGVIYAAYTVATTAATAGTWAFNAALLANPIGLVVVGIAGLIAAGYALYKNWDTVSAGLVAGWEWVKTTAWNFLTSLPEKAGFAVGYVVGWFKTLPERIIGIFKSMNSVGQTFIDMAIEWGKSAVNGIIDGFLSLPGRLKGILSNALESAKAGASAGEAAGSAGVAHNATGGIYGRGAFLTTFAEKSPEAAIPIDGSKRARDLWLRTGQLLGMIQQRRKSAMPVPNLPGTIPANTGYEPKPSLPKLNIPDSIKAVGQLTANLSVPGVFGALVKWLQRPGKKEEESAGLPAFPAQPTPIVNAMAATPNVQVAPAVSNIAPVINAMAKAPDVLVNPASVSPVINVPEGQPPAVSMPPFPEIPAPLVNATATAPGVVVDVESPAATIIRMAEQAAPEFSPLIKTMVQEPAPTDNSERARGLLIQTGEMLGLMKRNTAASLPEISLPEIRLPEINVPNTSAPVINNVFNITGVSEPGKIREEVEKAADLSLQKFRTLFNQMQMEQRRVSYS